MPFRRVLDSRGIHKGKERLVLIAEKSMAVQLKKGKRGSHLSDFLGDSVLWLS